MDDVPTIRRYDLCHLSTDERHALLQPAEGDPSSVIDAAGGVIGAVRDQGDLALARLAAEIDGADLDPADLQVTDGDFVHAFERLDPDLTRALDSVVNELRDFHEAELPQDLWLKEVRPGAFAGLRYRPIPSVACFVPRTDGPLPHPAVMATIPALIAKVPRVVIVTPPGPEGEVDDAVLVAAATAGVGEIYKASGVQAAAALAFGTETLPRVKKLIAVREAPFMAAQSLLAGRIEIAMTGAAIDAIILADESANVDLVTSNLILQSEMSAARSVYLVTTSTDLLDAVAARLAEAWPGLNAAAAARSKAALAGERGGAVLAPTPDAAIELVNEAGPAHLSVLAGDPFAYLGAIENAGEIRLGSSRVMAQSGASSIAASMSWRSPLSVFDFLKRSSIGYAAGRTFTSPALEAGLPEDFDGDAGFLSMDRETSVSG